MEKRADINPDYTPDLDEKPAVIIKCGRSVGKSTSSIERLDNDFSKQAADKVADATKPRN